MQIVTVINDWGDNSFYLPILKGKLYSVALGRGDECFSLVELSSNVSPFDIYTMCFIVKNSFQSFPEGTLHLLGVCGEPENESMALALYKGHYFLGIDDGRFSHIFDSEDYTIKRLPNPKGSSTFLFPLFAGEALEIIYDCGFNLLDDITAKKLVKELPVINSNSITGKVVFIDSYGNAITNIIGKQFFKALKMAVELYGEDVGVEICIHGPYIKLYDIHENYYQVERGNHIALFNSRGYLEFAVNRGNFAALEGIDINTEVSIIFR